MPHALWWQTHDILHGYWDSLNSRESTRPAFMAAMSKCIGFISHATLGPGELSRADDELRLDARVSGALSLNSVQQLDVLRFFASLCRNPPNDFQSFFSTPVTVGSQVVHLLDDLVECFGTQVANLDRPIPATIVGPPPQPLKVLLQTIHTLMRIVDGPHVGNQNLLADGELLRYVFTLLSTQVPKSSQELLGEPVEDGSDSDSDESIHVMTTLLSFAPRRRSSTDRRRLVAEEDDNDDGEDDEPGWPTVLGALWNLLTEMLQHSGARSDADRYIVHRLMIVKVHKSVLRTFLRLLYKPYTSLVRTTMGTVDVQQREALFKRLEPAYRLYGVLWRLAEADPTVAPDRNVMVGVLHGSQRSWWPGLTNVSRQQQTDARELAVVDGSSRTRAASMANLFESSSRNLRHSNSAMDLLSNSTLNADYAEAYHFFATHDTELRIWLQRQTGEAEVEIVPESNPNSRVRVQFRIPANVRVLLESRNERLYQLRRRFLDNCRRDKAENQLQDFMQVSAVMWRSYAGGCQR